MSAPADLSSAAASAEAAYSLPSGALTCIWQHEDGQYPNPYVNSSGYGGLFGTSQSQAQSMGFSLLDPGTTQQQANQAASVLAGCLSSHGGDLSAALSCYSGGGYSDCSGVAGGSANPFSALTNSKALLVGAGLLLGILLLEDLS